MPDGSLEPVRCGASNRCDYCAMFAALEAALVLKIDAELCQPTVGITTTTRRPDFGLDELRKAEHELWRALRRGREIGRRGRRRPDEPVVDAFPDLQYVGFLEFTTGGGTRAEGHRRPHIHHLVKGIPADHPLLRVLEVQDDAGATVYDARGRPKTTTKLEERVSDLWHAITGDAYIVECRPLRTPAGALAYLALHHHKRRQAPPIGFTGRRLRPSKGYYERPIAELRQLAQKLASHDKVVIAVKRAIAVTLHHDPDARADEIRADRELNDALVRALRDLARHPLELQLDTDGDVDYVTEKNELTRRAVAELERIRRQRAPELVRVVEVQELDRDTGVVFRRATAVLGPMAA